MAAYSPQRSCTEAIPARSKAYFVVTPRDKPSGVSNAALAQPSADASDPPFAARRVSVNLFVWAGLRRGAGELSGRPARLLAVGHSEKHVERWENPLDDVGVRDVLDRDRWVVEDVAGVELHLEHRRDDLRRGPVGDHTAVREVEHAANFGVRSRFEHG